MNIKQFYLIVCAGAMAVFFSTAGVCGGVDPAANDPAQHVRQAFSETIIDPGAMKDLILFIEKTYSRNEGQYPPVILAYYGALNVVRAKHAFLPTSKLSNLSRGLKILDRAVDENPNNLEVRFIRFSALHNPPDVLGIPARRSEDISLLCRWLLERDYSIVPLSLQREMIDFLLKSKRLTDSQADELTSLQKELSAP